MSSWNACTSASIGFSPVPGSEARRCSVGSEVDDLFSPGHRFDLDPAPLAVDANECFGEACILVAGDGILDEPHLRVVQPELVGPRLVHPVQPMELLDDGTGRGSPRFSVLEELVDGLGDQPNREIVVSVMAEDRLEERQTRCVLHDVPRLVDVEHDDRFETFARSYTSEISSCIVNAVLLSTKPSCTGQIKVDDLLVPDVEIGF